MPGFGFEGSVAMRAMRVSGLVFAVLAGSAAVLLACASPAGGQRGGGDGMGRGGGEGFGPGGMPTVTVHGEGVVSVRPDRALVRFGAVAEDEDAGEAQSAVNEIVGRATEAVRDLEIEGTVVQTRGLSLSPRYERGRGGGRAGEDPEIVGYRASLTIEVRVDEVERVGEVVDAALGEGANTLQGVSFMLRDDGEATGEALASAVGEARGKAERIASALGVALGGLVEVRERGVGVPGPRPMQRGVMMSMAEGSPTPVEAGEQEVRASVVMTYRLGG